MPGWLRAAGEGADSQTLAVGQPLSSGPRGAGRRWGLGRGWASAHSWGPAWPGWRRRPAPSHRSALLSLPPPQLGPRTRRGAGVQGSPRTAEADGAEGALRSNCGEVSCERPENRERRRKERELSDRLGDSQEKVVKSESLRSATKKKKEKLKWREAQEAKKIQSTQRDRKRPHKPGAPRTRTWVGCGGGEKGWGVSFTLPVDRVVP